MPTKVFNDFTGGHAGLLDLNKVPTNMWKGTNVILYRDGSLGPRPGLKALDVGGAIPAPFWGLGYIEAGNRSLIYAAGAAGSTNLHASDPNGASTRYAVGPVDLDSVPQVPAQIVDVTSGTGFINPGKGGMLYRFQPLAAAVDLTIKRGSTAFCVYGLRGVGSDDVEPRRLYYSATDDTVSAAGWPSGNFIDISISNRIVFLAAQRNHLLVVTGDGSWWILTGVPGGSNSVLRRITGGRMAPPQIAPAAFVDLGNDDVWVLDPTNNYPGMFDGAKYQDFPYLSMSDNPTDSYASGTQVQADNGAKALQGADNHSPAFVLPSHIAGPNGRMLLMHNGAWSFHTFGVPMSQHWASNGRGRLFGLNAAGSAIHTAQLRLDRPAFTSDPHAQPGDLSNTPLPAGFTLPHIWSDTGDEIQVNEVMIDFVSWNTGAVEPNRITATVHALAHGTNNTSLTQAQTWEEAGSESTTAQAGTPKRVRLNFGEQGSGAGAAVVLSLLRGVAIRQVFVLYDKVDHSTRTW